MSCIYLHLMDVGAADGSSGAKDGRKGGRKEARGGKVGCLLLRSVCRSVGRPGARGHEGQMEQNSLGNSVYLITASLPSSLPPSLSGERKTSPRSATDGRTTADAYNKELSQARTPLHPLLLLLP